MLLYQSLLVEVERQFAVHSLRRALALERDRRLEDVVLHQVQLEGLRCRVSEDVALLGRRLGEEFRHAVELRLDAVEAAGDGDGVVEDGILGVVGVGLVRGLELVEAEDIIDDLLISSVWARAACVPCVDWVVPVDIPAQLANAGLSSFWIVLPNVLVNSARREDMWEEGREASICR